MAFMFKESSTVVGALNSKYNYCHYPVAIVWRSRSKEYSAYAFRNSWFPLLPITIDGNAVWRSYVC